MDDIKPESKNIDDSLAEDAVPPEDEPASQDHVVEILEPKRRKGVGFGVVLFMSLLAAVIGVLGGAAGSRVLDQYMPAASGPNLQAEISTANETAETLKARLTSLEAQTGGADNADLIELAARITALESRAVVTASGEMMDPKVLERIEALEAKENTAPVDVSDIKARLADLETRPEPPVDNAGGLAATDPALLERLAALETMEPVAIDTALVERITALETRELPTLPEPVDLAPVLSRLEALEEKSANLRTDFEEAAAKRASVPLPVFPREDVVASISTVTEEDKGWIGRTLNKHVRVQDESLILIVDDIEALLLQGDVDRALARVGDLPAEGREAAKPWVDAVRIQRTPL